MTESWPVGSLFALTIIGWTETAVGEVWRCTKCFVDIVEVAFGQNDVTSTVIAPRSSMRTKRWEAEPYLDRSLSATPDWRSLG